MARPVKMGLDYFPYDCNTDRKIKLLNRKFGLLGEGFYLNLLKMIYANGYYLELCEETIDDLCIEFGLTIESFKMMLDFCIQKNLFSAEIFENNSVITSSGIQKRFIEATKRRKENNKIDIYEVNANNNSISVNINTQRKEKKRKEKERKEEKSNSECDLFEKWWIAYDKKTGKDKAKAKWDKLTQTEKESCLECVESYVQSTPDSQYRKNPLTYLNGKHWEDELEVPAPKQTFLQDMWDFANGPR